MRVSALELERAKAAANIRAAAQSNSSQYEKSQSSSEQLMNGDWEEIEVV